MLQRWGEHSVRAAQTLGTARSERFALFPWRAGGAGEGEAGGAEGAADVAEVVREVEAGGEVGGKRGTI